MSERRIPDSHVIVRHIETTPGVCGGKPRIAGHRISVQDVVVWHEKLGMTVDEIVSTYPSITPADVHAALAYYWDNQEAIEKQITRERRMVTTFKRRYPSRIPERLMGVGR
jgi:uncharacterized protein (DUF433 family)